MNLPLLTFSEWNGEPLEAETIYPESAAELKRMKPPRRRTLRVSTQSGTIPPPVDNHPA